MRRTFAVAAKDILGMMRDRTAFAFLLLMPVVLILILSFALGNAGEANPEPVAVVNLDGRPSSHDIADIFFTSDELAKVMDARRYEETGAARRAVARGDLAAALIIPEDFSERVEGSKPAELEVLTDPGRPVSGQVFGEIVRSVATRVSAVSIAVQTSVRAMHAARIPDQLIVSRIPDLARAAESGEFAPKSAVRTVGARSEGFEWDPKDFYAVSMSIMFLMFSSIFAANAVLKERTDGTLARLLTSPITKAEILGGKTVGNMVVGLGQFAILFAFTSLVIRADWGDVSGAWMIAAGEVVAATGLGVLIAALAGTPRAVGGIAPPIILLNAAAGGNWVPAAVFPEWLRPIHYFTINGWATDAILELQSGGSAGDVWVNAAVMAAIGVVLYLVGVWRLRWE